MKIIKTIPVYFYQEALGNEPVRSWLHTLSGDDRKIIGKDIRVVQMDWPVGMPLVKSLNDSLWEVRSKLDNRNARVIFIFYDGAMILLHGFIKKTQVTPQRELEVAKKRAKKLRGNI